jgi:AraC-like DNA-binding protein
VISSDLICPVFVYEKSAIQSKETFTDKYILALVTEGEGVLTVDGKKHALSPASAFFVGRNTHFSIVGDGLAYVYISFLGRRADELIERFNLREDNCIFDLGDRKEEIVQFEMDCLKKASEEKADILSECGLLYLISHLDSNKREANGLLYTIIELTNKGFTDPNFSLASLSNELNYSAKYLSSFFKKNKGVCFSEYLRSLRIKRSIFFMEQGITSVKNIALLSGFSDALYYSKIFKQEIGHSPKEHIESLSGD